MTAANPLDSIPHQPPMRLLRRLVQVEGEAAIAEAVFEPDSPFVRPGGAVDEAVYFELIAQTFAAMVAAQQTADGGGVGAGYLASLRTVQICGRAMAGETLLVRARLAGRVESFFIVEGSVRRGGEVLAEGQVTILVPGERSP